MLIKVEHLRKEFSPEVIPVRDFNCEIQQGDVISIIGPSGTGKSTFLNLLNRLEEPTAGKIWFEGEDTTARGYDLNEMRKKMGMVFQSFNLFSHLTLTENVMLGPVKLLGRSRQQAYDTALRLLKTVGLGDRALSLPQELSGGQQQRAAIARAMAMEPKVLLFDEPTSALDPTMVGEVLAVIRNLAKGGVTMLIVTHEMNFAREVSNRVFYLDEGVVYEEGSPSQIFERPQREKTRLFVKNVKVFRWNARESGKDFIGLSTELENFAYRNMMSPEITRKTRLLIEEVFAQIARSADINAAELSVSLEYADRKREAAAVIEWLGPAFDPIEEGDEYSRILIRHISPDAAWTGDGKQNRVRGTIRVQ